MTIEQYINKYNISYRELARRIGISVTYLINLKNGANSLINEKIGERFKEIAPEIDIKKEVKYFYRIKEEKNE